MAINDDTSTTTTTVNNNNNKNINIQSLFLSCLGIIHVIAFWSYYVQFPGLLSSSGIEPVRRLLPHAAPWIYTNWISSADNYGAGGVIDEDSLCELCAVLGMIVGSILASGACHHGLFWVVQTALYSFLVRTGGTFYSFQWDTLLLEATLVTALTFAPWLSLRSNTKTSNRASPWPLRFLLFKLMFMSGVVKVQANCPTWLNLTALEYHFATQCLPGPLAWHAHQLHPLFLRFSVAMTLWLELPATLLLLVPTMPRIRQTGAILQMLLQITIILTGSYNFFNLLTMALCLPVMMVEDDSIRPTDAKKYKKSSSSLWFSRSFVSHFIIWLYLIWSFSVMFEISPSSIHLVVTTAEVNRYTEQVVPVIFHLVLAFVAWTIVADTVAHKSISTFLHGTVCLLVIGVVALPLTSLTPKLQRGGLFGSKRIVAPLHKKYARPYHLSNGYGLFRRMTGVADVLPSDVTGGWDGLPPSVVARPEVILEGLFPSGDDDDSDNWQELSFRWKPGNNLNSLPFQVAPHQPRLDWQMWFAALGRLEKNPWLIHLVKKLLDGCEPVIDLLGADDNSVNALLLVKNGGVSKLRAKLYHYDFKRIESEWSKTIPGVEFVSKNDAPGSYWAEIMTINPDKVWSRKFIHDYMPPLESDNPSLVNYIQSHSYNSGCKSAVERCREAANSWCWIAKTIREKNLHLLAPFLMVIVLLNRGSSGKGRRSKAGVIKADMVVTGEKKSQ
jgi:uncharacterized membrane protein YphA (DoxX/SURF4 family)